MRGFIEHQDFLRVSELVAIEGTPAGLAFSTHRPVIRNKLDLEEFPTEVMRRLAARGIKSGCSVPLISHERVLGVLSLGSTRESAFDEDDVELLGQIGKQVAIAVENALNFGSAFEAQKELRRERDRSQLLLDVRYRAASLAQVVSPRAALGRRKSSCRRHIGRFDGISASALRHSCCQGLQALPPESSNSFLSNS